MKSKLVLLLICVCCILTSCNKADNEDEVHRLFFAWTEGYLASPVEQENVFALTFYCKKNASPFHLSEIVDIKFKNVLEQAISLQYTVEPLNIEEEDGYLAYAVYFTYTPRQVGVFEADSIMFTLNNGDQLYYPFGHIAFDIDETDSEIINTWESVAASSNSAIFPYSYSFNKKNAKLTKMQIGMDEIIFDVEGLEQSGRIHLEDSYSAPLVIIRAKLFIDYNAETLISYGKGCYCGAGNASESILNLSLEHWLSFD